MAALNWILFLLFVGLAFATPQRSARRKRGLLDLAGVIKCSTGRSALSYMMYGCYCGLGGQGWPRDRADWCCHKHDCCYGDVERAGCQTHTGNYRWTCEDKEADCESEKDKCEKMLCRCDKEVSKCLRRSPFIKKNAVWPDFLCGDVQPTCNIY
ncbi:group 10 secretory phospholipase A2 [Engraulis encrasicolus]|uniref:group 10 secretory phospholipase A2 n=1 Tax=Engraulis encrasicolus TaxID=184585 RepID=UPI002FD6B38E